MPVFLVHSSELMRILLTSASSWTCRILALTVLILSVAPLGSIYVLVQTLSSKEEIYEGQELDDAKFEWLNSIQMGSKQDPRSVEDLWTALMLQEEQAGIRQKDVFLLLQQAHDQFYHQKVRIVLPWMFSLVLGLGIPLLLTLYQVMQAYRQRRQRRQRQGLSRAKRDAQILNRARILNQLHEYSKTLTRKNRVIVTPDDTSEDATKKASLTDGDNDKSRQAWRLPRPGFPLVKATRIIATAKDDADSWRTVTEPCAICLTPYQSCDVVTWSSNPACIHCFHQSCLVEWFSRITGRRGANANAAAAPQEEEQQPKPCPCCRRPFQRTS